MEAYRPKIPRIIAGVAMHALPLAPMEGFVLSRIDAIASITDIADLTSLDLDEVTRIIDKLILLGAVEWADGTAHLPRMSAKPIAPPRATPNRPSQAPPNRVSEVQSSRPAIDATAARGAPASAPAAPRVPSADSMSPQGESSKAPPLAAATSAGDAPAAAPTDGIELAPERRKRIDDLYVAIDLLNHYEVLGISRRATKAEVRSAYFDLSKAFHPDTAFRKNVGNYRSKMEIIFKRLTEAYEVLGKKKAREEYDAYLESIGSARDAEEALSGENEIPEELRAPAPPEVTPPPPPVVTTPPPEMPARTTPTEEGKRVARELLQKRLGRSAMTASSSGAAMAPPRPEPEAPPVERNKREVLRDLTSSLKSSAVHTGGLDRVTRLLADGRKAEEAKDLAGAVRAYRLATALAPERRDIAEVHERLSTELAISLAGQYEQQAIYEEKTQKWASAATSWGKVIEGRPTDVNALTRAAITLVEAKGDLHNARKFAQQAVDLAPESAAAHFALGRVFHAANLTLNARRELELVRKLDPSNAMAQAMLKELAHQS